MNDSLRKRYLFKLGGGVIGVPLSLTVQAILMRALGTVGYGNFSFLMGYFNEIIAFLDSGTSAAFYAKICARPKEQGLLSFYWRFCLIILGLMLAFVAGVLLLGIAGIFWPDQQRRHVLLAAAGCAALWFTTNIGKVVDAYGCTVGGEKMRLVQRGVYAIAAGGLLALGLLSLDTVLIIHLLSAVLLGVLSVGVLRRANYVIFPVARLTRAATGDYLREFWTYSHPLVTYAFTGMLVGLADRWLLQQFGGSAEQGYFGLGTQASAACFLISSAFVPLLGREFAQAHQASDVNALRGLFKVQIPRFYTLTCLPAIYVACNADDIARIIGGPGFGSAGFVVALMCLAPIHQCYGQFNSAFYFATHRTREYRNVAGSVLLAGLPVSLVLLGPVHWHGMALGAAGLAMKVLVMQVAIVNIQLWGISRHLSIRFFHLLTQQVSTFLVLLVIGSLSKFLVMAFTSLWARLVFSLAIYIGLFAALTLLMPALLPVPVKRWMGEVLARFSAVK